MRFDYDAGGTLAGVLPAVAASLGVSGMPTGPVTWPVSPARRAIVLLVDGLGYDALQARSGHAPFLRSVRDGVVRLESGFPSTTPTSMGSFGTGLAPGRHGLVGFEVLDPDRDRLLNELSWEDGPDPVVWQPHSTIFERVVAHGIPVTMVGPGFFDGSGLTRAALRGGAFAAAHELDARVSAGLSAVRATPQALVYVYWGDLDKVGHVHGPESYEWGEELARVDAAIARLAAERPADCALYVTADHGMVEVPFEQRVDLAHDGELAAGIRHVGGEPRAPQLYCDPGAADDVVATWQARWGERAIVATRDQAIAAGWFGVVEARVHERIGDVVVAMTSNDAAVDSRVMRPQVLRLLGLHGSLTSAEVAIPLLGLSAPRPA